MAAVARKLELDPKYDNYDYPTTSATPQSGHPGYTTAEQDAKVHQLRMMLEQGGYKERLDTLTLVGSDEGVVEDIRNTDYQTATIPPRKKVRRQPCKADVSNSSFGSHLPSLTDMRQVHRLREMAKRVPGRR